MTTDTHPAGMAHETYLAMVQWFIDNEAERLRGEQRAVLVEDLQRELHVAAQTLESAEGGEARPSGVGIAHRCAELAAFDEVAKAAET